GEHTIGAQIDSSVDVDHFEFCGEAGDEAWIVWQTSTLLDPYVEVYAPDLTLLTSKSCSGGCCSGCSSEIRTVLPQSGRYTVLVSDSGSDEGGTYTLQIERVPPRLNPPSLLYNVALNDVIDQGTDTDFFVFEAPTLGVPVRLIVSTTTLLDPVIEIRRPDQTVVATPSCSGGCCSGCSFTHTWNIDQVGVHYL